MGLLDRLKKKEAKSSVDPAKALIAAMAYMVLAENKDEDELDGDIQTMIVVTRQVPELRDLTDADIGRRIKEVTKRAFDPDTIPEALRERAFVLAAEVALSSGDISDDEDERLGQLAEALHIDDMTAQKVIDVMAMKYVG